MVSGALLDLPAARLNGERRVGRRGESKASEDLCDMNGVFMCGFFCFERVVG